MESVEGRWYFLLVMIVNLSFTVRVIGCAADKAAKSKRKVQQKGLRSRRMNGNFFSEVYFYIQYYEERKNNALVFDLSFLGCPSMDRWIVRTCDLSKSSLSLSKSVTILSLSE